jgi:hypothetical protein
MDFILRKSTVNTIDIKVVGLSNTRFNLGQRNPTMKKHHCIRRRAGHRYLGLIVVILLIIPATVTARSYTFTMIADTSGLFSSFNVAPSLNNSGTVAFGAVLDTASAGVFTSNGGEVTTVFIGGAVAPSINGAGAVAFRGTADGTAIYTSVDGRVTSYGSYGDPAINNGGVLAFIAEPGPQQIVQPSLPVTWATLLASGIIVSTLMPMAR